MIVAFGQHPIMDIDALHRVLADQEPGVRSSVTVLRGTEKLSLSIEPTVV